jgi:hypothetical protein
MSKNNLKLYYCVYTVNEKVWLYADGCEIVNGVLSFFDIADDDGDLKVLTIAFQKEYWKYCYEADTETGESIPQQITFWKKHAVNNHSSQNDSRRLGLPINHLSSRNT